MADLILASSSPRRRDILTQLGIPFRARPSDADETRLMNEHADAYVMRVATRKVHDVVATRSASERDAFVLGADTIVVVDGDVLGKPVDDSDAEQMLARLVGRTHEVVTAVVLGGGPLDSVHAKRVTTEVTFRAATSDEVRAYVATGEGRDKAGAYAVQGLASGFVSGVHGSFSNVVGLPACETVLLLREHGVLAAWP